VGNRLRRLPWRVRYRAVPKFASYMRKVGLRLTHLHAHVSFGKYCRVGPGFVLEIPDDGTFITGLGVDFRRGFVCEISGDGRVEIGDLTVFTHDAVIQCTTSITIGRGCSIGQGALFVDGNHRFRDPDKPMRQQGYDFRPLTVGDGATIMSKCTLLADVGTGALIGAHSVVTKPVPPYCLAYGAPARVIEYFGPAELRPDGVPDRRIS
jgi:acetyltransferase-like isoleucine patch superfamily enzyme